MIELRIRTPWLDEQYSQGEPPTPETEAVYADGPSAADDVVLEGEVESSVSAADGEVEMGSLDVGIYTDRLTDAASPLDLRPGRHRAVVRVDGRDVIDGTIERTEVRADGPSPTTGERSWTVTVRDTAAAVVAAGLSDVRLRDGATLGRIRQESGEVSLQTLVHDHDLRVLAESWRWYDLRAMLAAALRQAGASAVDMGPEWTLGVWYTDADGSPALHRHRGVRYAVATARGRVPDWSGDDLWEFVRDITGALRSARYDAYPGGIITASVRDGRWREPAAEGLPQPPDVSELVGDAYDLILEPAEAPGLRLVLTPPT